MSRLAALLRALHRRPVPLPAAGSVRTRHYSSLGPH
jgi:hypothetical protein